MLFQDLENGVPADVTDNNVDGSPASEAVSDQDSEKDLTQ